VPSERPMNEAQQAADQIRAANPNVKSGTLRFRGHWFGRPYDNYHRLVGCDSEFDVLKLYFNEGEVLSQIGIAGNDRVRCAIQRHVLDSHVWTAEAAVPTCSVYRPYAALAAIGFRCIVYPS
jgi:hypothetical protein